MWIEGLIERLQGAQDAGSAAGMLIEALPDAPGKLRTMVQRRGARGVEHLELREHRRRAEGGHTPTSSAWSWAQRFPRGVVLDVEQARAVPVDGDPEALAVGDAISDGSRRLLSRRHVVQVAVVAMRSLGGDAQGLVAIELGEPLEDAPGFLAEVRARTLVAGRWVCGLPLPRVDGLADAHLPVVGVRMSERLSALASLARFGDSVLLRGPTGVGKSLLAEWVHARSGVKGPLLSLTVSSVPDNLLAGELYGWKRGAHSTAHEDRLGLLTAANGGTLFLDEVGTLGPEGQRVLLEALDGRGHRPLGSDAPKRQTNVRFVIATNEDLEEAVRVGKLREDVYRRLSGGRFDVPSLDERRDEIPGWVEVFARAKGEQVGVVVGVAPDVVAKWEAAPWPGNLRDLNQAVRDGVAHALGRGVTRVELEDVAAEAAVSGVGRRLEDAARAFVEAGLSLSDAAVFRAFVVEAAIARHGGVRAAFEALGEEALVASRNHHQEAKKLAGRRQGFRG